MNRYKCFIVFLLLFISGCSIKYDVSIDEKMKVSESIRLQESNSAFINNGTNSDIYINVNVDSYLNDKNYSNYKITKFFEDDYSGINASASYDDFKEFTKNNKIKKTLFGLIELYEKDGHGFFSATDYRGEVFFNVDEKEFINERVEFTLSLPFEVINNNADSVDVSTGKYTWFFDKDINDKEVNIEFNLKKVVVKENFFIKYYYIFIGFVALLIIIIFLRIKHSIVNRI